MICLKRKKRHFQHKWKKDLNWMTTKTVTYNDVTYNIDKLL